MSQRTLTLGHSPDPDDAFMFYGLATGKIDSGDWRFEHVLQDIQTLNERATRGELDITAISIHAYPYVADQYMLTTCGASMGDGYGPLVVSRRPMTIAELKGATILIPGEMTSAFLTLNILLGKGSFRHEIAAFDQILQAVADGRADAGLIIHEGQLTYRNQQLHNVIDLGAWWLEQTGLPLPLGGNCIRRALGQEAMEEVTGILETSIKYSLTHRKEALEHALGYARDTGLDLADRFVGMYVNDWTIDYGDKGRRAISELLRRGQACGVLPAALDLDVNFVGPSRG